MLDFKSILEHPDMGMFICENEKFIHVNDAFVHTFGFQDEKQFLKHHRSLEDLMTRTKYLEFFEELIQHERASVHDPIRFVLECHHPKGHSVFLEMYVKMIQQNNQRLIYATTNVKGNRTEQPPQKAPNTEGIKGFEKTRMWIDLHNAITENQLYLEYQPIVNLKTKKVSSVEALVRWKHPSMGLIAPNEFIPIAEESGLIKELGEWVLRTAIQEMKPIVEKYNMVLSVNVSVVQIMDREFIPDIKRTLDLENFNPARLKLEITETALYQSEDVMRDFIKTLNELNIGVCLDDFGIGYSLLNFVQMYEINAVKLDRSFLSQQMEDEKKMKIFTGIISLLQSLHMQIVVEGIETKEQFDYVLKMNCEEAQGFLFARPAPIHKLVKAIENIHTPFQVIR